MKTHECQHWDIEKLFLYLHDDYDFERSEYSYEQYGEDGSIVIFKNGSVSSRHTVESLMLAYILKHMDGELPRSGD